MKIILIGLIEASITNVEMFEDARNDTMQSLARKWLCEGCGRVQCWVTDDDQTFNLTWTGEHQNHYKFTDEDGGDA